MENVRHRTLISISLSTSRKRSAADCATELRRRETEYLRSIRSAVFLASNINCSKPSLAVRQAFLANLSKSLRWKARTVTALHRGIGRLWRRKGSSGCRHGRVVVMTTGKVTVNNRDSTKLKQEPSLVFAFQDF